MEFLKTGVEFNLVTIPEALAVRQLDDIFGEFRSYNLKIDHIIINQVVKHPDSDFLRTKSTMQQGYISEISTRFICDKRVLPMFPYEITGMDRLLEVERVLFGSSNL